MYFFSRCVLPVFTTTGDIFYIKGYRDDSYSPELVIGFTIYKVFTTKRGSLAPISIDLTYRRIYYTGKDYIKKIEIYIDRIALKPSTNVTFLYTPYIKGKGYSLPFGKFSYTIKKVYSNNAPKYKPLTTYLSSYKKRAIKLDLYIDKARLIAYDKGDNYVLYNIRTKKIVRSRNMIFNKNLALKDLPNPAYNLNITSINQYKFYYSPPPTIKDIDDIDLFTPVSPPLKASDPAILYKNTQLTFSSLSTIEDRLPNPDSFELHDNKIAGASGVLVEPQSSSREAINQDHTQVLGIPLFDIPRELGSRPRLTLIVLLADLSLIVTCFNSSLAR
ncbi:hypothetical protein N7530_006443 [Penicillium desertorum]|uniref:Retroviral polymerase SH3-like domain-containing protein n=1 Tax=Penicillium desertorum TaxID=1303715 RepID=A0A9W9WSI6_9EURO|nr:hypothetical protein N7530_006443 [Penicillium desertorum]